MNAISIPEKPICVAPVADESCTIGAALIVGPGATWLAAILYGAAVKAALGGIEVQDEAVISGDFFVTWRATVLDRNCALRALQKGTACDSVLAGTVLAWHCSAEGVWRTVGSPIDFGLFWTEQTIDAAQASLVEESKRQSNFREALRRALESLGDNSQAGGSH